jgi:hypothetical protein
MSKPDFIKAGADCVTRNGSKAHIYVTDAEGSDEPVHGTIKGEVYSWGVDGRYLLTGEESHWDLFGPWVEPKGAVS